MLCSVFVRTYHLGTRINNDSLTPAILLLDGDNDQFLYYFLIVFSIITLTFLFIVFFTVRQFDILVVLLD